MITIINMCKDISNIIKNFTELHGNTDKIFLTFTIKGWRCTIAPISKHTSRYKIDLPTSLKYNRKIYVYDFTVN